MLVSMKPILVQATKNRYGVVAPSVFNALTIEAAFEAAANVRAPMILNVGGPLDYSFLTEAARFYSARYPQIPVALNLDHGDDFHQCMVAIQAGFTSVMIDSSKQPYDENVRITKEIVHAAHMVGVSVEAELGHVGIGQSDDMSKEDLLTRPDEAKRFVEETEVDFLAVAVGTAHGHYRGAPHIDIERLDEIRKAVHIPLVLHGGSSTGDENLKNAICHGISKINIGTDLSDAARGNIEAFLKDFDPNARGVFGKMLATGMKGYREKLEYYLNLFGEKDRW